MKVMDLPTIIQHTVEHLAPALPFLLDAGHGAAKKLGEGGVGAASSVAQRLWNFLRPSAEAAQPALIDVAKDVAATPEDKDAQSALRHQLKKLLEAQPALQTELQNILGSTAIQQNTVAVSGTGAIGVGGSISGGSVSTNVTR